MALKVWLPLTGDLHNQGTYTLPEPVRNNLAYENGKIGQCGKSGTVGWHLSKDILENEWSVCTWYNTSFFGTYNNVIFCKNIKESSDCQIYFSIISNTSLNIGVNGPSGTINYTYTFNTDTWYHLAATYNGATVSLYLNGVLVKTGNSNTAKPANRLNMQINGRSASDDGVSTTGGISGAKFNDFRLYDHCLSAAEVHEIAMGLVLHYKLDGFMGGINENLIPANKISFNSTKEWIGTGWASQAISYDDLITLLKPSTKYTFSWDGEIIERTSVPTPYSLQMGFLFYSPSTSSANRSSQNNNHYEVGITWHTSTTFTTPDTIPSDYRVLYYTNRYTTNGNSPYGFDTIKFSNIKLEEGELETPWVANINDLGINTNIIEDSSGYGHNGTIIGNTSINSSTPRFQNSFKLLADGITNYQYNGAAYIVSEFGLTTPKQMTIAFWAYPENGYGNSANHSSFCTTSSTYPSDYNTTAFNHRDGGFDINYSSTASNAIRLTFPYSLGAWNHYAITYDGQTAKAYKNGALTNSTAFSSAHDLMSFTKIFIGLSAAGGAYRKTIGSYSDFRIYCTALLDNDIKMLYNMGMKIDNLGEIHTFDFIENKNNLMWRPESARAAGKGINYNEGLGSYTQANCQVTCDANGYRIYRPPNLTVSANGNTMYGGLRVRNSTNSGVHVYNATTDNIFGLVQGHTYIFIISVKGQSSNSASLGITNNMGWGGGGLIPSPTNVISGALGSNFEGEKEVYCKFTVSDAVVKTCTSSYSAFTSGNQYLSYMDFTFNFSYTDTGTLGTDLYITNIGLYDITNITTKLNKNGTLNITSLLENKNIAKIYQSGITKSTDFIEI